MGKILSAFKRALYATGRWFKNHAPTRRRIIQVYAALLTNANLSGFATGRIYTGSTKNLCAPGLNCYSCPGAIAACPLGALQNSLGSSGVTTPYYILGILALLGLSLGRTICGFLCPFGLAQELVYKVRTPKLKKSRYTRILSYLKYILLVVFVIAIPLIYHNVPAFCKYICPAGTFGGAGGLLANESNSDLYLMLGYLFSWKFIVLVICTVACVFVYRAFCRFICPLGAIYGFFNKIALLGVKLEKSKCIDCGKCVQTCKMDIKHVGDHECINCGECIAVCPTNAISWKGSRIFLPATSVAVAAPVTEADAPKLNAIIESGTVGNSTIATPVSDEPSAVAEPETKEAKTCDSAIKKVKKRGLIIEIVAWVLAAAVLIAALVYYNVGGKIRGVIPDFTLSAYNTAYGKDEYSNLTDTDPEKPLVIAFWSTRNENSLEYIPQFKAAYDELKTEANFLIVHVSNSDSEEVVQSKIDEMGWNEYPIAFVQDTSSIDLYSAANGEGAFPTTAFVDIHGEVHETIERALTTEEIASTIENIVYSTVYRVGDKLPSFGDLKAYESAYKEETVNLDSFRGKVLVINFWYVSCGPCTDELPFFEQVREEYGDEIAMVAIHSDNDEKPQPFIDREDPVKNKSRWSDWDIIFAQDTRSDYFGGESYIYSKLGGTSSYPMTVIVDADGYITYQFQGPVINKDMDRLRPEIDKAMKK